MFQYLLLSSILLCGTISAEPIKIGVNTFLTGSGAFWGDMTVKGLELALDEERAASGAGQPELKLLFSDFGDLNYAAAVGATHKFINIDRVAVIFANVAEDAQVIYPIAARAGIPVLAIAVGSETATIGKPGLFRTTSSDLVLWQESVDFLRAKGLTQGCWAVQQSEYFLDISRALEPYWQKQLGSTPYIESVNVNEGDLRSLVSKFKHKHCASVLLMSWIGPASEIVKKAALIQYRPQFIGPTNVSGNKEFLDLVRGDAEGLVFGKFSDGTQDFIEKFTKKYGRSPERPAATSYDALRVVAKVTRDFGTSREQILRGLSEVKNFAGASGIFSFRPDGTRSDELHELLVIRDGRAVSLTPGADAVLGAVELPGSSTR